MYNKRKFNKINDKKVLHKVKKQWVTISLSLLMLIGGGAAATHVSANADMNANHAVVTEPQPSGASRASGRASLNLSASKPASASVNYRQINREADHGYQTTKASARSYNNTKDDLVNTVDGDYGNLPWTPNVLSAYSDIANENVPLTSLNSDVSALGSAYHSAENMSDQAENANKSASYDVNPEMSYSANASENNSEVAPVNDAMGKLVSSYASAYSVVSSALNHRSLTSDFTSASESAMETIEEMKYDGDEDNEASLFPTLEAQMNNDKNNIINAVKSIRYSLAANTPNGLNPTPDRVIKSDLSDFARVNSYSNDINRLGNLAESSFNNLPDSTANGYANSENSTETANLMNAYNSGRSVNARNLTSSAESSIINSEVTSTIESNFYWQYGYEYGSNAGQIVSNVVSEEEAQAPSNKDFEIANQSYMNHVNSANASYISTLSGNAQVIAKDAVSGMKSVMASAQSSEASKNVSEAQTLNEVNSLFASQNNSLASSAYAKSGFKGAVTSSFVSAYNNSLMANTDFDNEFYANLSNLLENSYELAQESIADLSNNFESSSASIDGSVNGYLNSYSSASDSVNAVYSSFNEIVNSLDNETDGNYTDAGDNVYPDEFSTSSEYSEASKAASVAASESNSVQGPSISLSDAFNSVNSTYNSLSNSAKNSYNAAKSVQASLTKSAKSEYNSNSVMASEEAPVLSAMANVRNDGMFPQVAKDIGFGGLIQRSADSRVDSMFNAAVNGSASTNSGNSIDSASASASTSASQSASVSASLSASTSTANSVSASTSVSLSASTSASLSASTSISNSVVASQSASLSTAVSSADQSLSAASESASQANQAFESASLAASAYNSASQNYKSASSAVVSASSAVASASKANNSSDQSMALSAENVAKRAESNDVNVMKNNGSARNAYSKTSAKASSADQAASSATNVANSASNAEASFNGKHTSSATNPDNSAPIPPSPFVPFNLPSMPTSNVPETSTVNSVSSEVSSNSKHVAYNTHVSAKSKSIAKRSAEIKFAKATKALQLHTNRNFTRKNLVKTVKAGTSFRIERAVKAGNGTLRYEVRYDNKNYFIPANRRQVKVFYKKAKPVNKASHFHVRVLKALRLHTNAKFTKRNGVKVVYPGTEFWVKRIVKDHGLSSYEVNYRGHNYFITASRRYTTNAYLQTNDFRKRGRKAVLVIKPVDEYSNIKCTNKYVVRHFRRGSVLLVRRVITVTNSELTRLQLTNGRYVSSNKNYVKVIK